MGDVKEQVHNKFKLFAGKMGGDGSIAPVLAQAEAWVKKTGVAPKSIGVEYLEGAEELVLSIGYRDDEPGYAVKLTATLVAKVASTSEGELAHLEQRIAQLTKGSSGIICHELYVTEDHSFYMVLMTMA